MLALPQYLRGGAAQQISGHRDQRLVEPLRGHARRIAPQHGCSTGYRGPAIHWGVCVGARHLDPVGPQTQRLGRDLGEKETSRATRFNSFASTYGPFFSERPIASPALTDYVLDEPQLADPQGLNYFN